MATNSSLQLDVTLRSAPNLTSPLPRATSARSRRTLVVERGTRERRGRTEDDRLEIDALKSSRVTGSRGLAPIAHLRGPE